MNLREKLGEFLSGGLEKFFICVSIVVACYIVFIILRAVITRLGKKKYGLPGRPVNPNKAKTVSTMVISILRYLLFFIAGFSILVYLGVPETSLITVAGVGSVAIGLGSQQLVADVVAGFFIMLEEQYHVGDIVTIGGYTGTVESLNVRTTVIRALDGTQYIIPNGSITTVANMCKEYMNAVVDLDIDYKEDMEHALLVLNDQVSAAWRKIPAFLERPTVLGIINIFEGGYTVRIIGKCAVRENYEAERLLRLSLKKRLDKEGIAVPFRQVTVHSGDK